MKDRNRSSGTVRFFAVIRDHQGRTAMTLDHARGSNSDDAAMPSVAVDHQAVGFAQGSVFGEALLDGVDNPALFFLTFTVEFVEAIGDFLGAGSVFCAEKIDHLAGDVHSSGSVDSRRDAESDLARAERLASQAGNLEQGL